MISTYVFIQAEIDESCIAHLDLSDLPKNWRAEPAPKRLQTLDDEWLVSGKSAVLRVQLSAEPSASRFHKASDPQPGEILNR